jgi:HK97 family phage major capsid protein
MTDISRSTSGVLLPEAVSGEILQKVQEASAIQQRARRVILPGSGLSFQTIVGDPAAEWVGETAEKPVSNGTVGSKTMRAYKLAVIETFSNEFRRDKNALYNALAQRLPGALAKKFDSTVFHGTAPGSDFDTLSGAAEVTLGTNPMSGVGGPYDGFVNAMGDIAVAGYDMNGIILSPQGEGLLYGEKDGNERPLFINNVVTDGSIGSVLGRPIYKSRAAYKDGQAITSTVLGFAGDWSQAMWGTVEDVQIKISDQATLNVGETTINLFQQNMFAVLAEIEVGFIVADEDAFVKLTA